MARQICEHFVQDITNQESVKDQIQEYLDENPTYKVNSCSYTSTGLTREALIIFYDPEKKTHNLDEDD